MMLTRTQLLQFLSPEVADEVLASGRIEALLGGRRLEVSVLSCDVSEFRPLAESRPAAALTALNTILDQLAAAVLAQRGTLMSFPGDGLLAVFGAPIADPEHRRRAQRAEAEIRGPALARINDALGPRGLDPISLEVAIAGGEATVGVIGSAPRWEYAVIGDPTSEALAATSG
jgi:adenylate cyclase